MKQFVKSVVAIAALTSILNAGGKLVEPATTPVTPVSLPSVDEWSGPYVGVALGYLKGDTTASFRLQNRFTQPNLTIGPGATTPLIYNDIDLKPDGVAAGGFVGYNKRLQNNWLLGIELAANYTNAKKEKNLVVNNNTIEDSLELKQQYDLALYIKAGKIMGENENILPYILGGVTVARLKGTLNVNNKDYTDKDSVTGWTIGAGLEYKINKNWHVRVQYRFNKYDDASLKFTTPNTIYNVKINDYKSHLIQLGVSYHFN